MDLNPKVEEYVKSLKTWQEEIKTLRAIIGECNLKEDLKWGKPCYSYEKKNIVIIQGFKDYCALMFFKGVLLKDHRSLLIQVGSNSQSAKQLRFRSTGEMKKLKTVIKSYIKEAVDLEKSGLKVQFKKTADYEMPEELTAKLKKDRAFKAAFNRLTPGRQRGYILHFSQPKQAKTRLARIEKCTSLIMDGIGYNENYKRIKK